MVETTETGVLESVSCFQLAGFSFVLISKNHESAGHTFRADLGDLLQRPCGGKYDSPPLRFFSTARERTGPRGMGGKKK